MALAITRGPIFVAVGIDASALLFYPDCMSETSVSRIFNVRDVVFGSASALERELADRVQNSASYVQDLNHLFLPGRPHNNVELHVRALERVRRVTASPGPHDYRKLIGRDDH